MAKRLTFEQKIAKALACLAEPGGEIRQTWTSWSTPPCFCWNLREEFRVSWRLVDTLYNRGMISYRGMEYVGSGAIPNEERVWRITDAGRDALALQAEAQQQEDK